MTENDGQHEQQQHSSSWKSQTRDLATQKKKRNRMNEIKIDKKQEKIEKEKINQTKRNEMLSTSFVWIFISNDNGRQ